MIKKVLLFISSTLVLSAYQIGDSVESKVEEKLNLTTEKVYVIDFFASWCHSCRKEMPYLSKLNNMIDKNQIVLLGIDTDSDISKGKKFQKELREDKKLNFDVINDPESEIIKEFNPIGMPALFIVKDKKVVGSIIGAHDDIDKLVLAKLKELK